MAPDSITTTAKDGIQSERSPFAWQGEKKWLFPTLEKQEKGQKVLVFSRLFCSCQSSGDWGQSIHEGGRDIINVSFTWCLPHARRAEPRLLTSSLAHCKQCLCWALCYHSTFSQLVYAPSEQPCRAVYHICHFTDKEAEGWESQLICPRSYPWTLWVYKVK